MTRFERRLLWRVILMAVSDWSKGEGSMWHADAERFLFSEDGGLDDYCECLDVKAGDIRARLLRLGPERCREEFAVYGGGKRADARADLRATANHWVN